MSETIAIVGLDRPVYKVIAGIKSEGRVDDPVVRFVLDQLPGAHISYVFPHPFDENEEKVAALRLPEGMTLTALAERARQQTFIRQVFGGVPDTRTLDKIYGDPLLPNTNRLG